MLTCGLVDVGDRYRGPTDPLFPSSSNLVADEPTPPLTNDVRPAQFYSSDLTHQSLYHPCLFTFAWSLGVSCIGLLYTTMSSQREGFCMLWLGVMTACACQGLI